MTAQAKLAPVVAQDAELARLCARRDPAALRQVITANNQRLFRAAWSILKDRSEAEEAVQSAYLKAFARIGEFEGRSALSTWLTRIAINEALGRLRSSRRRQAHLEAQGVAYLDSYREALMRGSEAAAPDAALVREQLPQLLPCQAGVGLGRLGSAHQHLPIGFKHRYAFRFELGVTALGGAQPPQCFIDHDPGQPGRQRRSPGKIADPVERLEIGRLHGLLRIPAVLEDAPGGAEQPLVVGRDDVAQCRLVAGRAKPRQFDIVECLDRKLTLGGHAETFSTVRMPG